VSEVLETRLIDMAARPVSLNARILTRAVPPTLAAFPSRSLYGISGFVLAAGTGIMLVLFRSYLHLSRPVPIHLAERLNAPLLGGLPRLSGRALPKLRDGSPQRRLLTSALQDRRTDVVDDTLGAVAMEVEQIVREGHHRCLMMVSARKREGKTIVAVALGRALAANGMRVLLVDMDLRRPSVEQVLGTASRSPVTKSICELDEGRSIDILIDQDSGVHTYTPKPANPYMDPIRSLRSPELHTIVAGLRPRYDLVLFDTPSLLSLPHAQVIAGMVDSILLVTQLGRSSERELEEFSRRVTRTGKPICGVIVTNVRPEDTYWESY
jgi:Mrp family chromosome partitioning ATPase